MNFMFINNSPTKVRQTKIKNTAPAMHEQKKYCLTGSGSYFCLHSNYIRTE
jgi:hypothetical protein